MKIKIIAALSIAVAGALPMATVANACGGGHDPFDFVSPTGNISCKLEADGSAAFCEVRDHNWAAPASVKGNNGQSCNFDSAGPQVYLEQGKPPSLGCYEEPGKFTYANSARRTLDYGKTHTHGATTCESETSGVTCTDTVTGHFFRVSRESYELG